MMVLENIQSTKNWKNRKKKLEKKILVKVIRPFLLILAFRVVLFPFQYEVVFEGCSNSDVGVD